MNHKIKVKLKILIDFDNTIARSSESILKIYDNKYGLKGEYNPNELQWNFEGLIEQEHLDEVVGWFNDYEFYCRLEPFEDAVRVIKELNKTHDVYICTKQDARGIPYKDKWIKEHLGNIKTIYLVQDDYNKGIDCDIIIDDKIECLESSNAKLKICYGRYGYNSSTDEYRVNNWKELEKVFKI